LARWFPRTYPHDVPRLRRLCRIFPDESTAQKEILDSLEQDGELELDIAERIRRKDADRQVEEKEGSKPWLDLATIARESRSPADGVSDHDRGCEPESCSAA
jgi:hypothetical protein